MTSRARRIAVTIALIGTVVFAVLTVLVASTGTLGLDRGAFRVAGDLREPWLDDAAKLITHLGLLVFVGPAVLLSGAVLLRSGRRAQAAALVIGAALTWVGVWITKWAVDRPRPPAPLVHTVGQSFPSGHAANAVGWCALAIALMPLIRSRGLRVAIVTAGALLTVMIGLSRIYLRAHYASDVLGGVALAAAIYALVAIVALVGPTARVGSQAKGGVGIR